MQSDRLPLKWFSPFPLADGFKGGEKRTEFARDIFSVGGKKKRGSMMLLQLPWKKKHLEEEEGGGSEQMRTGRSDGRPNRKAL